jgi:protein-L-isoaspartate(D-aspartate) O-methyltransferase
MRQGQDTGHGWGYAQIVRGAVILALLFAVRDEYAAERLRMAREDIEARGIRHSGVLKSMRETPRHRFVPAALRALSYEDHPLPIGRGQTISQPYVVAFMTELLDPKPAHRVLEIGTGSGYQAAVLSPLVKEVCTVEIVPELAREAAALLRELGYANIRTRLGDGYLGWPEKAPFDRILLTAAPPEVPDALLRQLAPGGRLVAPVGVDYQNLMVIDKRPDGTLNRQVSIPVRFVPMVKGP